MSKDYQVRYFGPYHQSDFRDFLLCPMKVYYRRLRNLQPEFTPIYFARGNAIHVVLESLHAVFDTKNAEMIALAQSPEEISNAIRNALERQDRYAKPAIDWTKDGGKQSAIDKIIETWSPIIAAYANDPENYNSVTRLREQKFRVNIGKYTFAGTVDQVRQSPDSKIRLIDFKTSDSNPSEDYLAMNFQLMIYAYALQHGEIYYPKLDWLSFDDICDEVGLVNLPDYDIYKRAQNNVRLDNKSESYQQWARSMPGYNAETDTVSFVKGDRKGPANYTIPVNRINFDWLIEEAGRICGAIRMNLFYRAGLINNRSGRECDMCDYISACRADMKQTKLDKAEINHLKKLNQIMLEVA